MPELLSPGEAAKILRCGRTTVYELIRTGQLEAYKPGGAWRLTQAQLAAYLESTLGDRR